MISLSTRVLIATLAIGVTVPSASMRTGTGFLTASCDLDRNGAWSARRLRDGALRRPQAAPRRHDRARHRSNRGHAQHQRPFFHSVRAGHSISPRPGSLSSSLAPFHNDSFWFANRSFYHIRLRLRTG